MFHHTHRIKTQAVDLTTLWQVWSDVNSWAQWQADIEYAQLETEFATGQYFTFKPKGEPKLRLGLVYVSPERCFIDVTCFFGAQLIDSHEFIQHDDGVEIITTLTLSGPLAWLWQRLVVNDIASSLPEQTKASIEHATSIAHNGA